MRHGLSFGYSTAAEMSRSESGWKERLRRIGLFLLLVALLALFFRYVTRSVDHKISAPNASEASSNLATQ